MIRKMSFILTPNEWTTFLLGTAFIIAIFSFILYVYNKYKARRLKNGYSKEKDKSRKGEVQRGEHGFYSGQRRETGRTETGSIRGIDRGTNTGISESSKQPFSFRRSDLPDVSKVDRTEQVTSRNPKLSDSNAGPTKIDWADFS